MSVRFVDPSQPEGQFVALFVLLLVFILLRCFGMDWSQNGYEMVLAAILVLLRAHPAPAPPAPPGGGK